MGHHSSKHSKNRGKSSSTRCRRHSSKQRPTSLVSNLQASPVDKSNYDKREHEHDLSLGPVLQRISQSENHDICTSIQPIKPPSIRDNSIINPNLESQDAECLIAQLEAVLEKPDKFSTHHKTIARLASRVSNLLDGGCLINQLQELIDQPKKFSQHGEKLTMLTRRASTVFESPYQTYHRVAYSGLLLVLGRIAQDCGLVKILVENKTETFGVAELVEKTGVDKNKLEIFLEYLAAQHIIEDVGEFSYKANNITMNLSEPIAIHGLPVFDDLLFPIIRCLGASLNDADGQNAYQIAFKTSLDLATWLENNPDLEKGVYGLLQHQWDFVPSWLGVVDFKEEFARDSDDQSFVFVEVFGGSGNQCVALLETHPDLKGRVIWQDTPVLLHRTRVPDRVEKVPYDLYTDQYIRGANVYYFRQVLHTKSDEEVVRILQTQLPAMKDDSVLLIDEKVISNVKLPESPSSLNVVETSILMVACFNTFERRQSHWLKLLDEAGYEAVQIHPYSDLQDCIIIAKRKLRSSSWKPYLMDQNDFLSLGVDEDLARDLVQTYRPT